MPLRLYGMPLRCLYSPRLPGRSLRAEKTQAIGARPLRKRTSVQRARVGRLEDAHPLLLAAGLGRPLPLLHGLLGPWRHLGTQLDPFAKLVAVGQGLSVRIVGITMTNHGSPSPGGARSPSRMTRHDACADDGLRLRAVRLDAMALEPRAGTADEEDVGRGATRQGQR